ncbi:hypothetical protein P7K49_036003 [Saguinus oedipus]|uniref:Uncharacterized protein n=1 Tax=Saguinus oedipus TaxID=9490 RepID=A0ABQ9TP73_SAGOE|nr:hypothetical protein P7K49_036003 [Saguinus oedipus]
MVKPLFCSDIIDPAILRPGRLDKTLFVGLPPPADRLAILKTITKKSWIDLEPHWAECMTCMEEQDPHAASLCPVCLCQPAALSKELLALQFHILILPHPPEVMTERELAPKSKLSFERHYTTTVFSYLFAGADLSALVREASVCALRQEMARQKSGNEKGELKISHKHFEEAFKKVRSSISKKDQVMYERLQESLTQ